MFGNTIHNSVLQRISDNDNTPVKILLITKIGFKDRHLVISLVNINRLVIVLTNSILISLK